MNSFYSFNNYALGAFSTKGGGISASPICSLCVPSVDVPGCALLVSYGTGTLVRLWYLYLVPLCMEYCLMSVECRVPGALVWILLFNGKSA